MRGKGIKVNIKLSLKRYILVLRYYHILGYCEIAWNPESSSNIIIWTGSVRLEKDGEYYLKFRKHNYFLNAPEDCPLHN